MGRKRERERERETDFPAVFSPTIPKLYRSLPTRCLDEQVLSCWVVMIIPYPLPQHKHTFFVRDDVSELPRPMHEPSPPRRSLPFFSPNLFVSCPFDVKQSARLAASIHAFKIVSVAGEDDNVRRTTEGRAHTRRFPNKQRSSERRSTV